MRTCIVCSSTKNVAYAGPKCVNCYRRDNPDVVKRIAERNSLRKKTSSDRFVIAKAQAKDRSIPWKITKAEFLEINQKPCFYCGGPLPEKGTGLDRISNDKSVGYTADNVVPCCTTCNSIRGNKLTVTETLAAVDAIKERRLEVVREYHESGVHLDLRSVFLSGEITTETATTFIKAIDDLEAINRHARILVRVMSEGGSWSDALAIYDRLRRSTCPVIMVGTGMVASSATVIMQAGAVRFVTPTCSFMVHDGSEGFEGQPKSFESWSEASKRDRELMYNIYSQRSGKTTIYWENTCSRDTFFFGDQIVKVGLADKVLDYDEDPLVMGEILSEEEVT